MIYPSQQPFSHQLVFINRHMMIVISFEKFAKRFHFEQQNQLLQVNPLNQNLQVSLTSISSSYCCTYQSSEHAVSYSRSRRYTLSSSRQFSTQSHSYSKSTCTANCMQSSLYTLIDNEISIFLILASSRSFRRWFIERFSISCCC